MRFRVSCRDLLFLSADPLFLSSITSLEQLDMEEIIPLISSGTEGPLGVKHLPRLWLKTLLAAFDRLPPGYKDIRPEFDYIVLEGLNIDPDAARTFITKTRPTYLDFEKWIRSQKGVNLSPNNIRDVNRAVVGRTKSQASRQGILSENGLPRETVITDSIMLNNLDDWRTIYSTIPRVWRSLSGREHGLTFSSSDSILHPA